MLADRSTHPRARAGLVTTYAAVGAVCSVVSLAACHDQQPVGPRLSAPAVSAVAAPVPKQFGRFRTIDDEYLELALTGAPGFGGISVDSATGAVQARLTDLSRADVARPAVAALVSRLGLARAGAPIEFRQAQFDYQQLTTAFRDLLKTLPTGGITQRDIDEVRNRVVIGVIDAAAAERVAAAVARRSLPMGIVSVELIAPTVTEETLQNTTRRYAGVQITNDHGGICTLGYNVRRNNYFTGIYDASPAYFVTASHCTNPYEGVADGTVTSTTFGQPDMSRPVGVEVADAPFISNAEDPACAVDASTGQSRRCRYSDAALIQYNPGVIDGWEKMLRPMPLGTFATYTFVSSASSVPVGTTVSKVGRTTGASSAQVTGTCVHTTQYIDYGYGPVDTGVDMLCQQQSTYNSGGGDSGAPVYTVASGTNNANISGIHWGVTSDRYRDPTGNARRTFSPYDYVSYELRYIWGEPFLPAAYCPGDSSNPACPF